MSCALCEPVLHSRIAVLHVALTQTIAEDETTCVDIMTSGSRCMTLRRDESTAYRPPRVAAAARGPGSYLGSRQSARALHANRRDG